LLPTLNDFCVLGNVSLIDAAWNSHTTYEVYEYNYIYLLKMLWQDASVWGKNTIAQNKITQKDMTAVADHWHSCRVVDTTCLMKLHIHLAKMKLILKVSDTKLAPDKWLTIFCSTQFHVLIIYLSRLFVCCFFSSKFSASTIVLVGVPPPDPCEGYLQSYYILLVFLEQHVCKKYKNISIHESKSIKSITRQRFPLILRNKANKAPNLTLKERRHG